MLRHTPTFLRADVETLWLVVRVTLPEPARVMQPLLDEHMGRVAPVIRVRDDASLFVGGRGLLEACAVTEPKRIGDPDWSSDVVVHK